MSVPRYERIDALRGFAVFGILLVNVWGFVYGYSALRYGVIDSAAPAADRLAVFFSAAFAEQKFYPIFSFLFGAGFALQIKSLTRAHGHTEAIRVHRRRLGWLLAVGLLHGSLLWFGDILTAYALTGFWVFRMGWRRLEDVGTSFRMALGVNVLLMLLLAVISASIAFSEDYATDAVARSAAEHAVYTTGDIGAVALARLSDFGSNVGSLWLFMPRLMLLFLLGVFAVRLGWLTRPHRHRRGWCAILVAGLLAALPLNLWWGIAAVDMGLGATDPWLHVPLFLLDMSGPALGAAYVAVFMLAPARVIDAVSAWLAPVGRMALSNYLMQSLACALLLHGWGLGLGAVLSRAQLMQLCVAIMLAQVLGSRWWLARHAQGPMEAMWRRYTYACRPAILPPLRQDTP